MPRPSRAALVGALVVLSACRAGQQRHGNLPAEAGPAVPARPDVLPEDRHGVVGGPVDSTAFDFSPEPGDRHTFVLDGVEEVPDEVRRGLAPYLDARRARLASVGAGGSPLVVLTRLGETTQAYRVSEPLGAREQLTFGDEPVAQVALVPGDRSTLVYRSDRGGDESFQLYRLRIGTGRPELITDGRSRHGPFRVVAGGLLLFTANTRDDSHMDVYLADLATGGTPRLLLERQGSWVAGALSRDGRYVLLREYRAFTETSYHLVNLRTGEIGPLAPPAAGVGYQDARFSPDGRTVYVTSNRESDVLQLWAVDLVTRAFRPLTPDIGWDVEHLAVSPDGETVYFSTNEDGRSVVYSQHLASGARVRLEGLPECVVSNLIVASPGTVLGLALETSTSPMDAYTYDLARRQLTRWTQSEVGGLDTARFVEPELVRVESFDGLEVPAWYFRPRSPGPHPVLLWIHGGPEEQHRPGFSPIIQYVVSELGVAVLAPNLRGSDGYGRRYLGLDDGLRREDAVRDVGAVLDWVAARDELDETRVGIYGASYGGYLVLASLVRYGERIVAGAEQVGISSFVTFLEATAPYRRAQRRPEYGDEREPEVRAFLESISPLARASEIRSALFVAHGENDPRVPVSQAVRIVEEVRASGVEAWLAVARGEGHGFRRAANLETFYRLMATFFSRHLLAAPVPPPGLGEPDPTEP